MLQMTCLPLGIYQTNCYIIRDKNSASCCVLDPGSEADQVLDYLNEQNLTLEAILLTHCHFDHVGAVRDIAAETDCRVFLCPEDLTLPGAFTAGKLYYTDTYAEGSVLNLAGLEIRVLHTPGHTPGSVCLMVNDAIFSGDTLFADSCGRTDLPGGDWATIRASLNRLASIEADFNVFPGHGESTTLAREKKYNPYMR